MGWARLLRWKEGKAPPLRLMWTTPRGNGYKAKGNAQTPLFHWFWPPPHLSGVILMRPVLHLAMWSTYLHPPWSLPDGPLTMAHLQPHTAQHGLGGLWLTLSGIAKGHGAVWPFRWWLPQRKTLTWAPVPMRKTTLCQGTVLIQTASSPMTRCSPIYIKGSKRSHGADVEVHKTMSSSAFTPAFLNVLGPADDINTVMGLLSYHSGIDADIKECRGFTARTKAAMSGRKSVCAASCAEPVVYVCVCLCSWRQQTCHWQFKTPFWGHYDNLTQ